MRSARSWILLLCFVTLVGCGQGGFSKRTQAGKENVLRYALATTPVTLDPGKVQDVDTHDLLRQVFEGLVTWGEDNRIRPQLAESWEIVDGGKTYVFHLRKDATFHNGRPVVAADFKWTMERNLRPAFKSPTAATYLNDIVGAADAIAGRSATVAGIEATDDHTLTIRIDKPRPYFLGKISYPPAQVVPKEVVGEGGEVNAIEKMVGTGPFKAGRYTPDQLLTLVANSGYWGGAPKIEGIERPIIKDGATRVNKYKAGELDWVGPERQEIPAFQRDPKFKDQLTFVPRPAVVYIGMNPGGYAPFQRRDVRRAFAMAVDNVQIARDVQAGMVDAAKGILPPGVLGHRENPARIAFDPAGAKRLLASAGYPDPGAMPELILTVREQTADARIVGEAVITQLRENLGVPAKLQTMEWKTMLEKRNKKELGFYLMSWYADYLDPENFLSLLFTGYSPHNSLNYSNPEVDRLCAAGDTFVGSEAERLKLYARAEDILLQDAPWIPLYFVKDGILIQPRVKGLRFNLFGAMPMDSVSLAPR
ncbi:MAG: peptide ABC transporter substrate-binding protein [Fimbriimonadaceae bacterium]|nr:peptide ABC transporter substrate-binding protein [Fimbriimonadaceae bacterium]